MTKPGEKIAITEPCKKVVTSSLINKGIHLSYTQPELCHEVCKVSVDLAEVTHMAKLWEISLIVYVVGDSPTIESLRRFIAAGWNNVSPPMFFWHQEGYFIVHFSSMSDRDLILAGGPCTMGKRPLILRKWPANFSLMKEVLRVFPV